MPQPTSDEKLPFNLVSGVRARPSASAQGSRPKSVVQFCEIQTDEVAGLEALLPVHRGHWPCATCKLSRHQPQQVIPTRYPKVSVSFRSDWRADAFACLPS